MYSQDLQQQYSGASPYIFNRHNPNSRSSLLDQLTAWSTEWATVFRPGAFYQATQLLAPPPSGFFTLHKSSYQHPSSSYSPPPPVSHQYTPAVASTNGHRVTQSQLPPAASAGKYAFEIAALAPDDM